MSPSGVSTVGGQDQPASCILIAVVSTAQASITLTWVEH
jgi:hypothetical protein